MIAIYDQDGDIVICTQGRIKVIADTAEVYWTSVGTLGYYNKLEQAMYVRDQIALAIDQGKTLYRMPGAEEVERQLIPPKRHCHTCAGYHKDKGEVFSEICKTCEKENSNWQSKE